MEKNTSNYKFLNAKDRAAERKRSSSVMDTDRYHYKTAPHVQTGKRKRDSDGFFTPYAMFRPYSGTGLLCAIFGETPARKTSDLRVTQDMLSKEAYEHEIELLMCQAKAYELQFHKRFCAEDRAEECYAKAVAAGKHPDAPKLTAEDTKQTILDAVTWRFDWIQQNKRKCYRFAEILIDAKEHRLVTDREENFVDLFVRNAALMPELNRKLIDCMYEVAWYSIYMFKYGLDGQKVPAPWYDTKENDSGKGRVND